MLNHFEKNLVLLRTEKNAISRYAHVERNIASLPSHFWFRSSSFSDWGHELWPRPQIEITLFYEMPRITME